MIALAPAPTVAQAAWNEMMLLPSAFSPKIWVIVPVGSPPSVRVSTATHPVCILLRAATGVSSNYASLPRSSIPFLVSSSERMALPDFCCLGESFTNPPFSRPSMAFWTASFGNSAER